MIILDTNVLSEGLRPSPSPTVLAWVREQAAGSLFTTAITEAELLYGAALLPAGRRRRTLEQAINQAFLDFDGKVLAFDRPAAREYANVVASRRGGGRPISEPDARIAAIARSHGAILATRNLADFDTCGIKVISPWAG